MGFAADKFVSARVQARTETVPVPDLADWFEPGEPPVWVVRGLSANDLVRADAAKDARRRESALVEALQSGAHAEIVRNLQAMLGRSDDVQPDMARRLELLVAGSVEPTCSVELAVRLGEHFPVVFFQLTNTILTLTGRGSDVEKKPSGSTATPASKPPSSSPN